MAHREGKSKVKQLVLAIDDDPALLYVLKRIVESGGYQVILATDGISGLSALKKEKPDLVLLDVTMPGMDGFTVLKSIRQFSNVPVIMVTAKPEQDFIGVSADLGADDYIAKPFDQSVLIARIRAKLRRIETEKEEKNKFVIV